MRFQLRAIIAIVIKADVLVLCDDVILDAESKRQSLVSLFDKVMVEKVPVLLHRMCVFVKLNGSAGHHTAYIELKAPAEAQLPPSEVTCPFDLKKDGDLHNIKAAFSPVPLHVYGRYTISVLDENKRHLAETFLDVVPKEQ